MTTTQTTTIAPAVPIELPAHELARALKNAALFTSRGTERPVLCHIQLEAAPPVLRLVATDSYALIVEDLGVSELTAVPAELEGQVGHIDTSLPAFKALLTVLGAKTHAANAPNVTITFGEVPYGTTTQIRLYGTDEPSFIFPALSGSYPRWGQVVRFDVTPGLHDGGELGIGRAQLARISKVVPAGDAKVDNPLRLSAEDDRRPMTWRLGSTIRIAQMPVRLGA
jgi:hypothetical protein